MKKKLADLHGTVRLGCCSRSSTLCAFYIVKIGWIHFFILYSGYYYWKICDWIMFQVFFNWENLVPVQHFACIEMFKDWYRCIEIDPSFQMKCCTVCAASNSLAAFSWCPSLQHPPYPHPTPTSPTKGHSVTFGLYCVFIFLIIFVFRVSLARGALVYK